MTSEGHSDARAPVAEPSPAPPPAQRQPTPNSRYNRWLPIFPALIVALVWEISANLFFPQFLPRPSRIVAAIPEVMTDPDFWGAAIDTTLAILEGIAIGLILGVPVGLILGRYAPARWFSERYLHALNAMPVVAIIPLTTLWLGYSNTMRIFVTALSAFLPITIQMMDGTRKLPTEYLDVARSFLARDRQVWTGVAIPASMPFLISGVQIATGRAMVTGITSEMVAAIQGLGFWVIFEVRSFHHDQGFVGVLFIAALGISLWRTVKWATTRFVPWYRPSID